MAVEFRLARADDVGPVAALMVSSGAETYRYLYGDDAEGYVEHEFRSGQGFCGYRGVSVAVLDGEVVGTGCFYGRDDYDRRMRASLRTVFGYFGWLGASRLVWRSRHVGSQMKPPKPGELYLANFGVRSDLRGQGIGSGLIRWALRRARDEGYTLFGLDVASNNPRGQALYERLGMRVVKEKRFADSGAGIPSCRKMELAL